MGIFKENRLRLTLAVLVAASLLLLGFFQFRWLEQLREEARYRMQRTANWSTFWFARDFDGALGHIYRLFQVDYREQGTVPEQLSLQYADWVREFRNPELIESIYWVDNDELTGLRIREFTGTDHLVELREWPEKIAHLERGFFDALEYSDRQLDSLIGPTALQADIPALVIQQLVLRPRESLPERRAVSWVVAVLNERVLWDRFVPDLASQHYGNDGESEFDIAIVEASDRRTAVYESKPGTAQQVAEPDVDRGIFRLHPAEFPERIGTNRRILRVIEGNNEPQWVLLARHPAGSLDVALAAVRNRNLFISFGVLLLLGVSVLMLVVSTRRAQRLAAQQMEFVAGVSHELRTPLAVIRSAGENLADAVIHDTEHSRRYGELIQSEARRLSDMVEKVLLFARMRAGAQGLELEPVSVSELVGEAVEALEPLLRESSVEVAVELADELPLMMADRGDLKTAVHNLLSNAVKYSPAGSRVVVEAHAVGNGERREVQIAVRDRGHGIPSSDLAHVFEPFFRGQAARDAQIEGSGLGLNLVKQVVEAHGGRVWVSSDRDNGTAFYVRLPAAATASG